MGSWRAAPEYERLLALSPSQSAPLPAERVRERLARDLPHVELALERFESPDYRGLRVLFGGKNAAGEHLPLADTGAFDWVARLTSNARLRFVASGLGIQLLPLLFRRPSPGGEDAAPAGR